GSAPPSPSRCRTAPAVAGIRQSQTSSHPRSAEFECARRSLAPPSAGRAVIVCDATIISAVMLDDRLARQIAFLVEADKLKTIVRRTPLVDASRLENSAEHSWHLVLAD